MIDERALRHAFSDYAEALVRRYDIGTVLYRLTDQVVDVLGVDGAGVSLGQDADALQFVAATDDRASRLEEAQIEAGDGPCYEAFRSGETVVVEDISRHAAWPGFRDVAQEVGFAAVAGVPMPVSDVRIGALDLYRDSAHAWTTDELDVAQLLANVASGYVLNWRTVEETRTLAGQLQHALDSRVVIEQAKGVLVARHGIPPAEAFERLRRHARNTSSRLHDIARQVVDGDLVL